MASKSGYLESPDGAKYIPATQRADGTWRKPRRVKDGYVPQEEVPLYESKGKQFATRQNTGYPVGLTPEIIAAASKPKKKAQTANVVSPIPGLIVNVESSSKKKKKKKAPAPVQEITEKIAATKIDTSSLPPSQQDPAKRLRNLKKKLRDIENLEEKIKSGELKNPEKEQLEKVSKKKEVLCEMSLLEIACLESE